MVSVGWVAAWVLLSCARAKAHRVNSAIKSCFKLVPFSIKSGGGSSRPLVERTTAKWKLASIFCQHSDCCPLLRNASNAGSYSMIYSGPNEVQTHTYRRPLIQIRGRCPGFGSRGKKKTRLASPKQKRKEKRKRDGPLGRPEVQSLGFS